MLRSVDISDYMIHRPVKIHAEDDMSTAIGLVLDNKISGICVVNEHGDLVGVLSEMDCLKAILNATNKESGDLGRAGDYMTKDIEYCDIHADLVDVADDMIKKGHRRRPVLDHGNLVGQITCRQLLRVVSEFNQRAVPL